MIVRNIHTSIGCSLRWLQVFRPESQDKRAGLKSGENNFKSAGERSALNCCDATSAAHALAAIVLMLHSPYFNLARVQDIAMATRSGVLAAWRLSACLFPQIRMALTVASGSGARRSSKSNRRGWSTLSLSERATRMTYRPVASGGPSGAVMSCLGRRTEFRSAGVANMPAAGEGRSPGFQCGFPRPVVCAA
jgi:hypothetical protein